MEQDARLLTFLESASLLRLADSLRAASLDEFVALLGEDSSGRLNLLAALKTAGVSALSDRQKFASELAKAIRSSSLPGENVERPALPPPVCDKCDGKHETALCPHFSKAREQHADARRDPGGAKKSLFGAMASVSGPHEVLRGPGVAIRRQPGDGNCLFHSLAHGLRDRGRTTAYSLRAEIVDFIETNPALELIDAPVKDWVMWETALSVPEYCARMRRPGEWGGAIEMAVFAQLTGCHVLVYETDRSQQATVVGYRRIHTFAPTPPKAADSSNGGGSAGGSSTSRLLYGTPPQQQKEVRVLYSGGMHYDAVDTDADGGRGGSLLSDAAYTMSAGHPGLGSSALHRSPYAASGLGGPTFVSANSELTARGGGGGAADISGRLREVNSGSLSGYMFGKL